MTKISDLTAKATPDAADLVVLVDVSDTTDSPQGTTKRSTAGTLKGADGEQGPAGPPGSSTLSSTWTYETETVAPPSTGSIRADAASPSTTIWISETDADAVDRSAELSTLVGGASQILLRDTTGQFAHYEIDSVNDDGAYRSLGVTLISSSVASVKKGATIYVDLVADTEAKVSQSGDTMTGALAITTSDLPPLRATRLGGTGAPIEAVLQTDGSGGGIRVRAITSGRGTLDVSDDEGASFTTFLMADLVQGVVDLLTGSGMTQLRVFGDLSVQGDYLDLPVDVAAGQTALTIWRGTEAQYTALGTYDADTLYLRTP